MLSYHSRSKKSRQGSSLYFSFGRCHSTSSGSPHPLQNTQKICVTFKNTVKNIHETGIGKCVLIVKYIVRGLIKSIVILDTNFAWFLFFDIFLKVDSRGLGINTKISYLTARSKVFIDHLNVTIDQAYVPLQPWA
jgi:hypothetical protein